MFGVFPECLADLREPLFEHMGKEFARALADSLDGVQLVGVDDGAFRRLFEGFCLLFEEPGHPARGHGRAQIGIFVEVATFPGEERLAPPLACLLDLAVFGCGGVLGRGCRSNDLGSHGVFLVYSCFRWKQSLYTSVKIEHDKHEDKGRSHHAQRPLRAGEHVSIVNLFGVMRQVVSCDEDGQGEGCDGPFFQASSDGNDRSRYEDGGDVMKRSVSQPERGFSVGLIKVLECFWRDGHDDAVGHGDGPRDENSDVDQDLSLAWIVKNRNVGRVLQEETPVREICPEGFDSVCDGDEKDTCDEGRRGKSEISSHGVAHLCVWVCAIYTDINLGPSEAQRT